MSRSWIECLKSYEEKETESPVPSNDTRPKNQNRSEQIFFLQLAASEWKDILRAHFRRCSLLCVYSPLPTWGCYEHVCNTLETSTRLRENSEVFVNSSPEARKSVTRAMEAAQLRLLPSVMKHLRVADIESL